MATPSVPLKEIFYEALRMADPARRSAYLAAVCTDAAVRRRIEALIRASEASAAFLDDAAVPPAHAADPATGPDDATRSAANPATPSLIGTVIARRYKLLEEIGEGGMGTVWVAEQTEPIKRKVALKLIKAGMDSRSVLARFEAERQALAIMDHPSIAKVLDGGVTEAGRPFFVMEYVKGIPITEYCDTARLSVDARLQLFVQICAAVQHAHQKGIIHRDLKPSNILVALYDDRPVPKVIDFGLVKALHQSLTERTLHTAHQSVLGTPLYMSPEQAQLNNLDVDTRSDIYALGVLLYELLTGTTPLERKRFKEAAWDEVQRIIREEEPPRPSARLSSTDTLPSLAACRRTEPLKLTRLVRGDLDWIVMKALEKDRGRRYDTASAFALDVQRYLAGDAVVAAPPSVGYRLRKFVRRHRGPVFAVLTIVALLVVGVTISTWLTVWALDSESKERDQRLAAENAKKELGVQRDEARAARREADQRLYLGHMAFAQMAWDDGRIGRLRDLLAGVLPARTGGVDLRGFEWHYWNRLCERGSLLKLEGGGPLAYSPDGRRLAYVVGEFDENGKEIKPLEIRICNSITGAPLQSLRPKNLPQALAFSSDGEFLVSVSVDAADDTQDYVQVWNLVKPADVRSVKLDAGVLYLTCSPSGHLLAAMTTKGAFLWDFTSGKVATRLGTSDAVVKAMAFDPAGTKVLVAAEFWKEHGDGSSAVEGHKLLAFDVRTMRSMSALTIEMAVERGDQFQEACFSSDGRRLAALMGRERMYLWDTATGKPIRDWLHGGFGSVFSPDGTMLASGGVNGSVKLWNVDEGRLLRSYKGHHANVSALAFSPDGVHLASTAQGDRDLSEEVRVWDLTTPQEIRTLPRLPHDFPEGLSLSTDGKYLARIGFKHAMMQETATGREVWWSPTIDGFFSTACLDGAARRLAAIVVYKDIDDKKSAKGTTIHVWDISRGNVVLQRSVSPTNSNSSRLVFSPDGRLLASLTNQGDVADLPKVPLELHVWDVESGKELWALNLPASNRIFTSIPALMFAPDGKRVAMSWADTIKFWDARSGEEAPALKHPGNWLAEFTFSLDGRWLACANGAVVDVIDLQTGQPQSTLAGHGGAVQSVAFSPDSCRLVTCCEDGSVKVWDPLTAPELLTLKGASDRIAFSRSGHLLVGESRTDRTIRIWDASPLDSADAVLASRLYALEATARRYREAQEYTRAATVLEDTLALRTKELGDADLGTISTKQTLAEVLQEDRQYDQALQIHRELTGYYGRRMGDEHALALNAKRGMASCQRYLQKYDAAERTHREVLETCTAKLGVNHAETLRTRKSLAEILELQEKYDQAEPIRKELVRYFSAKDGAKNDDMRVARTSLADLYSKWHKYDQAEPLYGALHAEIKARFATEPNLIHVLENLGSTLAHVYEKQKQFAKAEPLRKEVIALKKGSYGADHDWTLWAESELALLYSAWGKPELAEPILVDVVKRSKQERDQYLQRLIDFYEQSGRMEDAGKRRREMLTLWKSRAEDASSYATGLAVYGLELLEKRNWAVAEFVLRECLAIREKEEPDAWTTFNAKSMLGGAVLGLKKHADAEPLLLQGYQGMKQRQKTIPPKGKRRLQEAIDRLIDLYLSTNNPAEAKRWQAEKAASDAGK